MTFTAREFKNFPVTMTLTDWLASAAAAHKAKTENKTRKSYSKRTYDCANREDIEKKMKMASNFIKKTTVTPLLKMDAVSMLAGIFDIVKIIQNMETPTKPSSTGLLSDG